MNPIIKTGDIVTLMKSTELLPDFRGITGVVVATDNPGYGKLRVNFSCIDRYNVIVNEEYIATIVPGYRTGPSRWMEEVS